MSFLFRYLRFHDIIGGIHVPVDDGVDKLNRKYTLLVFLFLALPIFTKQYIGDPIECFAPVYFAEHQSRYINSYCWTQSTYYMVPVGDPEDDGDQQEPPDRIMPDEVDYFIGFETVTHIGNERLRRVRVSYYQWAPLILLAQGLCFYIPFLIWNSCANNAGVKLRRLLKKASDIASLPPGCQQREALLAEFVDQFHTLVTGEAGWCADLQCGGGGGLCGSGGGGGAGGGGLNGPPSNASSTSSGNSSGSSANGPGGQQAAAGRSGAGQDRGHRGQQQAGRAGGRGDTDRSDHRHQNNNNDDINNSTGGCCLLSIPILSCCLKPCAPFGLVGPSKYLCLLYLAVKFAYVFNVGLQFFLLGQFLGRGYLRHGLELINRLIISGEWWASPRFPLSTLCQVRADMSGGLRSYTCQTFETNRISYIRLCLWRTRLVELNQIHRTVRRLSQSYLGWDGVFLLRLIEHNHGSIMATLIMSRLWEFYANQMKLQEDANQLALANNAQHTLSNIAATAISNQHQLMAAAAVAAQQHQQAHHHPQQQQPQQQQQQQLVHAHHGGGGGGAHHGPQAPSSHSHHHGPAGHGHTHGHHHGPPAGGHFHAVLQPTTATGPAGGQAHFGGGGGTSGPMVPPAPSAAAMLPHTGQHAHHSGQISQPPGHHPLHAANTAHHGHNTSTLSGPHLSGAFTNSSLLAQLQHQQSLHGASQTANSLQQQQQQPAGNVAAAVAALAAATAATNQQQANAASAGPQLNNNNNSNSNNTTSNSNSTSNGQPAGGAGSGPQAAGKGPANPSAANLHHHHHPTIHLHSLMQTPASGGQPQQQQSAQPQQQQQQQVAPSSQSATTSFITSASGTGGTASSGPPLPPPPPAHVVAAVAAATANSGGASAGAPGSARGTGGPPAPGPAPVGAASRPGAPSSNPILFNLKSSSQLVQQQQQQQQAASGQANPTNQSASTATTGASAGPSGPATGRQFNSPHQTKR